MSDKLRDAVSDDIQDVLGIQIDSYDAADRVIERFAVGRNDAGRKLRAEWYRKGLHDVRKVPVAELRQLVASFGRELFAVCDELEDTGD